MMAQSEEPVSNVARGLFVFPAQRGLSEGRIVGLLEVVDGVVVALDPGVQLDALGGEQFGQDLGGGQAGVVLDWLVGESGMLAKDGLASQGEGGLQQQERLALWRRAEGGGRRGRWRGITSPPAGRARRARH